MTKKILTLIASIALLGLLMVPSGCVKEDFDSVPPMEDTSSWVKTVSIAQVKDLFNSANNPARVAGLVKKLATNSFWDAILAQGVADSSIIFEGYVVSCDSAGNFYETVTIMDETGGIDLKVNASELYITYGLKPGKKVLVKVNNMALDNYRGTYQVGLGYTDAGTLKVTGVDLSNLPKYVQRSGRRVNLSPITLKINEINTSHVQKLIKIDSVQFWNPAATYSLPGVNTNRILVDKYGRQLILRTSGYSKFISEKVPSGSGSITGVLGVYDGTYQLYIRDLNDVQFNDPRFGAQAPTTNKTIAELKALCTSNLVLINQDIVVEAVVNANDKSGNLYKQLFIEDASGAIELKIDVAGLYADFPVGTKVVINCRGLYLGKYGGVIQLGGIYNGSIGRLSSTEFYNKVFIVESGLDVTPIETNIAEINDNLIGKIITLPEVQFISSELGLTYAGSSTTNRNIQDINGAKIIVRTSNFSDFASNQLPNGSGSITAVLSKYGSDYQLYIRSLSDVQLRQPRFEIQLPTVNTTIAELKAMYTSGTMQITQDVIIEGVIVGNDISGNLYKQLFIDDGTAGIEFKVNVTNLYQSYPVGTKIIVKCNGMYLGTYGGVIQLGGLYNGSFGRIEATEFNNKVFTNGTETVTPVETTITGINDSMLAKLVKLQNVQFIDSDLGKTYATTTTTNRTLEDNGGNTIIVRTSNFATFASTTLPSTSGTIYAILSKYNGTYQLYIREIADVNFNQTRMP